MTALAWGYFPGVNVTIFVFSLSFSRYAPIYRITKEAYCNGPRYKVAIFSKNAAGVYRQSREWRLGRSTQEINALIAGGKTSDTHNWSVLLTNKREHACENALARASSTLHNNSSPAPCFFVCPRCFLTHLLYPFPRPLSLQLETNGFNLSHCVFLSMKRFNAKDSCPFVPKCGLVPSCPFSCHLYAW
ncbi:unnamed protein product [Acanthosepion pharaonis]|uniref:Uncharacterized protein n=1 Tax=Acanthosepion pharaonis TaxID=158019 RepID=A0A812AWM8_ACAPH|nr:unnamed protein product [Sepia pharaonis]